MKKRDFKPKQKQQTFFLKAARGADAQGRTNFRWFFVVFKESKMAQQLQNYT